MASHPMPLPFEYRVYLLARDFHRWPWELYEDGVPTAGVAACLEWADLEAKARFHKSTTGSSHG